MRYLLVDGQGNFGSVDGDNAAAMRYTEMPPGEDRRASCSPTSTRRPSTSCPNYDGKREASRSVLPTRAAEPAGQRLVRHRGGHGDQHPAAQPERGRSTPACTLLDDPDAHDRRADRASCRRRTSRPPGIIYGLAGVREGYRTGRGRVVMRARTPLRGHRQGRAPGDHRRRAALPGEQGDAARAHRRAGARQEARGHLRPARRVRQVRHAHGDRAQARRGARGRAEQPVQADAAAGHLRHEHGGAGRRPAARCST